MQSMSKQNNVNPGQYKVGGREHSEGHGEAILHEKEKAELKAHDGKHVAQNEHPLPGSKENDQER